MKSSAEIFVKQLSDQIAQGEIGLVLEQLDSFLRSNSPGLHNEAVLLCARYNRLRREQLRGTVSWEVYQTELTRLTNGLLELLKLIPDAASPDRLPALAPRPGQVEIPGEVSLEKILGVNNLKQIYWLERGLAVSRFVCRILTPAGLATGFLIAPGTIMTNNHVLPDLDLAAQALVEFNYQHDFSGNERPVVRYRLNTTRFYTNEGLDYSIVDVQPEPNKPTVSSWGHAVLNPYADPIDGEHVTIVQHPNGGLKQIALTANQVAGIRDHRLFYTTDTMPGSSGAPVFNDLWQVIGLHHAGGELLVNSKGDKRFVNEGILISAINDDSERPWPIVRNSE